MHSNRYAKTASQYIQNDIKGRAIYLCVSMTCSSFCDRLLQQGSQINLPILQPARVRLIRCGPLHLLIPKLPNQGLVDLLYTHPFAEEVIQPQVPTAPQHPIDIEQHELEHCLRYPPVHCMPAPDQIHRPIEHRQPLLQRDMQGHEPPKCGCLIVRCAKVHGGGHNGHIVHLHGGSESARAATDVDPEPKDRTSRLSNLKQLRNREIQLRCVGGEF